jgi:hypothetical protein
LIQPKLPNILNYFLYRHKSVWGLIAKANISIKLVDSCFLIYRFQTVKVLHTSLYNPKLWTIKYLAGFLFVGEAIVPIGVWK